MLDELAAVFRTALIIAIPLFAACWALITLTSIPYPLNYPIAFLPIEVATAYALTLEARKFQHQPDDRMFDRSSEALDKIQRELAKKKPL